MQSREGGDSAVFRKVNREDGEKKEELGGREKSGGDDNDEVGRGSGRRTAKACLLLLRKTVQGERDDKIEPFFFLVR